jgi:hypothetical protein
MFKTWFLSQVVTILTCDYVNFLKGLLLFNAQMYVVGCYFLSWEKCLVQIWLGITKHVEQIFNNVLFEENVEDGKPHNMVWHKTALAVKRQAQKCFE